MAHSFAAINWIIIELTKTLLNDQKLKITSKEIICNWPHGQQRPNTNAAPFSAKVAITVNGLFF